MRQKTMGKDLISSLGDDVLHHILSLIPTRQAVQSHILSRRWRHLWKSVQTLNFDSPDLVSQTSDVFADKVLDLRCPSPITALRVSDDREVYPGNKLTLFLIGSGSLWVELYFWDNVNYRRTKGFPSDCLRSLHLSDIRVPFPLKLLISSCPALEDLSLVSCGCESLHICSGKLKRLTLIKSGTYGSTKMTLSTPNLRSLKLDYWIYEILGNLSSLVRASLSSLNGSHRLFVLNVNAFHSVKVLSLDCLHLQAFCKKDAATTFGNLKSLTINCCWPYVEVNTGAITSLLHHTPILETLAVNCSSIFVLKCNHQKQKRGVSTHKKQKRGVSTHKNMPLCFNHLKAVELRNFGSSPAEIELIEILSRSMKVAEGHLTVIPATND